MIRVCLVDDQTLVRQGVRSLLELSANIRVIAEAGDGNRERARHATTLRTETSPCRLIAIAPIMCPRSHPTN